MNLLPGTRLGRYEILAPLGAGGMGQVYRARDLRLNRTVAIKVLPESVAHHAEARERFEREARAISSLNHPNICVLYDAGAEGDIDYLVLEYLEGETLAKRLQPGPLPLEQALDYAVQIARAMDHAHRHGITHRDLKPANVILTAAGVKLLDFGLAKLRQGSAEAAAELTQKGSVMGTFRYMAPEQVEGKQTDARTDIFAFGSLVYEMVTGRKAFEGQTQAAVVTAILSAEPPAMSSLEPRAPAALERVVKTCLAKAPDDRWQTARDLLRELEWALAEGVSVHPQSANHHSPLGRWLWPALALGLALALAAAIGYLWRPVTEAPVVRFQLPAPEKASYARLPLGGPISISPDGRRLAFAAADGDGGQNLWLRSLDSLAAEMLPGTRGALHPFWAPDGKSIGFFAQDRLQRISIGAAGTPGPVQVVCEVQRGFGGTWSRDGVIVFGSAHFDGLWRVAAGGGTPIPITAIRRGRSEVRHIQPHFLPDGRSFWYLALDGEPKTASLFVGSLDSPSQQDQAPLLTGVSHAAYAPDRELLFFVRGGVLLAPRPTPPAQFC